MKYVRTYTYQYGKSLPIGEEVGMNKVNGGDYSEGDDETDPHPYKQR